jgi:hypothetical protein
LKEANLYHATMDARRKARIHQEASMKAAWKKAM